MPIGEPQRKSASLGVIWIALALIFAAFLGAALGLVWQSSGFGQEEPQEKVLTGKKKPG